MECFCLYSAFAHYGLSTQVPSATCIAIEAKRKVRLPEYPPIDLYYWKKENLEFGIVKKNISVYEVLITDMERTVCDAVKYRNKIGLDVCGEVIDNYLKKETRNVSLLHEYAQKLRVKKNIDYIFGDKAMTKKLGKNFLKCLICFSIFAPNC